MPTKKLGAQAIGMGLAEKARDALSIAVPMLHGSEVQEAAVKALGILIRALPSHESAPVALPQSGAVPAMPGPVPQPGAMQ
ncbi:MAG: hypothetical protein ACRD52_00690 [Candidatus Acidiferrales bacterium]